MGSKTVKKMLSEISLKSKLEVIIISEIRILMKKLGYEDSELTVEKISEIQGSVNNIMDHSIKTIDEFYDDGNKEALVELKDFTHEICPIHRNYELGDILEKFK